MRLNNRRNKKNRIFKYSICVVICCSFAFGMYQYFTSNSRIVEKGNSEQPVDRNLFVEDLKDDEELNSTIMNLPVVGVGDSVMLGAAEELYDEFHKGYFDAKVSRSGWAAPGILQELKDKGMLGDPVILGLGTNGDCPESEKIKIMQICEDRQVFWINVTNDDKVHVNNVLESFASEYNNLHIIDWNSASLGHSEYFGSDGIHLTKEGKAAYVKTVREKLYEVYSEKFIIGTSLYKNNKTHLPEKI